MSVFVQERDSRSLSKSSTELCESEQNDEHLLEEILNSTFAHEAVVIMTDFYRQYRCRYIPHTGNVEATSPISQVSTVVCWIFSALHIISLTCWFAALDLEPVSRAASQSNNM